ncbi:MAG: DNA primase [Planctomycetota bacterium]|nr:MAG: DNA primase [Planctomycetota bacterium]
MSVPVPDFRDLVDRVKERIEIDQVIGRRVQLQRRGNQLVGLCPFHPEKTPSFHVTPDKGFFKCFGCDKSGDVLTFVMEMDGLDFLEALRLLAEEAGVELPRLGRGEGGGDSGRRQAAREALRRARELYRAELASPAAAPARAYLAERGLREETLETFGVGWAPAEPGWLAGRLLREGFSEQVLTEAGLVVRPEGGGRLRDRFWDRIVFPVADRAGRTVGFGGRYLPGSRAEERGLGKYVNSPEGPLFPKRRLLYGLDRLAAALREAPADAPILLCEGYLDVLLLVQAGFPCAVAALGTALTEDHARALRRHGRAVALLLDPDEAGRRAAFRAGRILVAEGIPVRVVDLPDGVDPADMVSSGRTGELSQRLAESRDILDWRLDSWVRKADFADPAVRARAAHEAAEWIQTTPDPALAEFWSGRAGDRLGITGESLRRLVRHRSDSPRPAAAVFPSRPTRSALEVLSQNEREILSALLHDPSLYPRHKAELEALRLEDPLAAQALKWCQDRRNKGLPFDLPLALAAFPRGEAASWLDRVRRQPPPDCARALEEALGMLPASREEVLREKGRNRSREGGAPSDEDLARLQRPIRIRSADED